MLSEHDMTRIKEELLQLLQEKMGQHQFEGLKSLKTSGEPHHKVDSSGDIKPGEPQSDKVPKMLDASGNVEDAEPKKGEGSALEEASETPQEESEEDAVTPMMQRIKAARRAKMGG